MLVSKSMTRKLVTVAPQTDVLTARALMSEKRIRHLPVIEENRVLVGIVTDRDIRSAMPGLLEKISHAALRAGEELAGQTDVVEYKFTKKENVARVMKMGVKNLPSIYINGELAYSSIIPSNRELVEKIRESANSES